MPTKIVIGLDGQSSGERALTYAKRMATLIGDCELLLVYVIEWSPYTFQTAEENAERHKRREEEISKAENVVIQPMLDNLASEDFAARGIVRHGNVAELLDKIAVEEKAEQMVVSRSTESGLARRIFGSSTANLVMHARVPVTVVG